MPILNKPAIQVKKVIAVFLLLTFLNQLFAPSIAYALTAGPTAPEATSFEPIDTTDMVNPLTGSFTYNLPLLEVPGPEGGYPLSLSYHAGIQPNEDASWVGLGWTLNPGAIARNVNGYPDDWSAQAGDGGTTSNYWVGGHTHSFDIGVSVGIGQSAASVSVGLSFSQDTYRGFGVGIDFGAEERLGGEGNPFSVGVNIGVSPYGQQYASIGLDYTAGVSGGQGMSATTGVALSTDFNSVNESISENIGLGGHNSLGASLSSSGIKPSYQLGGAQATITDVNKGRVTTESSGFHVSIPVYYVNINLGYSAQRYYSNTSSTFTANGVINNRSTVADYGSDLATIDDDNYSLLDPSDAGILQNPDPLKQMGGTYPDFDNYSVTGQGLGGNIRPYIFASVLYNQNKVDVNHSGRSVYSDVASFTTNPYYTMGSKWQFRFINDMSNTYLQAHPWTTDMTYNFDSTPVYGNNDGDYGYDKNYDSNKGRYNNRLEGSHHIEYFTNAEISNGTAAARGFITCADAGGFERANCQPTQIGGFMITNSSGVTYHYALPAYSSNEVSLTKKNDGSANSSLTKTTPYAYTWYLTAITGADYVSRGTSDEQQRGLLDQNDWGYWVKFDYGKWTDNYNWRNPSTGTMPDMDNQYSNYSYGTKQIYYLDAVSTRSHTAIFEKELRADGKGISTYGAVNQTFNPSTKTLDDGGPQDYGDPIPPVVIPTYPTPTLRLKNILLFKNEQLPVDINTLRQSSSNYTFSFSYNGNANITGGTQNVLNGTYVIDKFDVAAYPALLQNCLRRIAFNHDFSLCPGAINSFDPTGSNTYQATPAQPDSFLGKLTLLSIDFQGKAGVPVTPPLQFQYDLDESEPSNHTTITINQPSGLNGTMVQIGSSLTIGDILRFSAADNKTYYCTVLATQDNGLCNVRYLNAAPTQSQTGVYAVKTKNPPYNADAYDMWNFYKSDYLPGATNPNLSRTTTPTSGKAADVWSLRRIVSSLGSNINVNYEGNTYNRAVLNRDPTMMASPANANNGVSLTINSCTVGTNLNSDYSLTFHVDNPQNRDLTSLFPLGARIGGVIMFMAKGTLLQGYSASDLRNYKFTNVKSVDPFNNLVTINLDPQIFNDLLPSSNTYFTNFNCVIGNLNTDYTATDINYGGGIRTNNIIVNDLNGSQRQTCYDYSSAGNSQSTSGITSYLPTIFDLDNLSSVTLDAAVVNNAPNYATDLFNNYRKILYSYNSNLLNIAREVPPPGVMYENVRVSDFNILPDGITKVPVDGSVVYQYETFKPEMIGFYDYNNEPTQPVSNQHEEGLGSGTNVGFVYDQAKRDRTIKDYTSRIGILKRMITYDNNGNKLAEKINHYLHDDLDNTSFQNQINNYEYRLSNYNNVNYNNIGVIKERYGVHRFVGEDRKDQTHQTGLDIYREVIMQSNMETFPTFQTGTTQIDYKNGTSSSQSNLAYDFYTGAVTKTLTSDSYGNRFISEGTPAYIAGGVGSQLYPALGLRTHDDNAGASQHKQMLTQQAANYTFSADANNNKVGVIKATVQTWANQIPVLDQDGNLTTTGQANIWRMDGNYMWMPSGNSTNNVTPYTSFIDYYASGGGANPSWKNTSEITKYNVYSAALEAKDINTHYAATRMGYNNAQVVITGGPAHYDEIAFAGAEDPVLGNGKFSTNVSQGDGTIVNNPSNAHTGTNSLLVQSQTNGFTYTLATARKQNYTVAVWVKATASNIAQAQLYYQVGSGSVITPVQTLAKTAANWYLLEMTVPTAALDGSSNLTVGCKNASTAALFFDDFRFQPTSASTMAYVYDGKTGELTYILGNNNLYLKYQYDAIGRLVKTYKEVLGKPNIPMINSIAYNYARHTFYNQAMSQTFYSKNCGTNLPQAIVYTVPANRYSSTLSPLDVYTQAMADINANGQNYANTNGTCVTTASFVLNNSTGNQYQVLFQGSSGSYIYDFSGTVYLPYGVYSVDIYESDEPGDVIHHITLGSQPMVSAPRHIFNGIVIDASTSSSDRVITIN